MNPVSQFQSQCRAEIAELGQAPEIRDASLNWMTATQKFHYSYHFSALGRPIIQYPQDMVAIQELIWSIRPTLIIETGVAHGGSLILSAASLALLDYTDTAKGRGVLDIHTSTRRVVGLDIDIRAHNRAALDAHPLRHKITLVEGPSTDPATVASIHEMVKPDDRVLVMLDSNHSHAHVLAELEAYAPLVSQGSYCVVFDTIVEDLPPDIFPDRNWNVGNNPKTAVHAWLNEQGHAARTGLDGAPLRFEIDQMIDNKLLISAAPHGYLRRLGT